MRLLLISNSGTPFLVHCREQIAAFLAPTCRVGYITAARLGDEEAQFVRARNALNEVDVEVEHLTLGVDLSGRVERCEAVFSSGGNTYALLSRLRSVGALEALTALVREGMPYIGTSAGTNIAGPNILATNDWNVVAANRFDGMQLVPWIINPHCVQIDPSMAPGSETRDQRIGEFLKVNDWPVLGIEEQTSVRVEDGVATVGGLGRARLFRRGKAPVWSAAGEQVPMTEVELDA